MNTYQNEKHTHVDVNYDWNFNERFITILINRCIKTHPPTNAIFHSLLIITKGPFSHINPNNGVRHNNQQRTKKPFATKNYSDMWIETEAYRMRNPSAAEPVIQDMAPCDHNVCVEPISCIFALCVRRSFVEFCPNHFDEVIGQQILYHTRNSS